MKRQKHKYLDEIISPTEIVQNICLPDKRENEWEEQRAEYGFDERETWCMDVAFFQWLYERLRMYKEIGGEVVNLDFHKFDVNGNEMTQLQIIDRMLELLPWQIKKDTWDQPDYGDEICNLWRIVCPAMWW